MSQGQVNPSVTSRNSSLITALFSDDYGAADEGSLFVFTNATPGTAIATTTSVVDDATGATTHAQQKPVMWIANNWTASPAVQAQNIYMRSFKMVISQVPTSATAWKYAFRLTPNIGAKITTAGTAITPVRCNSSSGVSSRASIQFGAITATDSTTDTGQYIVAAGQVSGAIPVANDEWLFTFGHAGLASIDSIGTQTLLKRLTVPLPPIVIAPQWGLVLEMWGASNAAAPSWEFEGTYIERPAGQ